MYNKWIAKTHDEINLVCISVLLLFMFYTFAVSDPFNDLLSARVHTFLESGYSYTDTETLYPIFFWLQDELPLTEWEMPHIYSYLALTILAYINFDFLYIMFWPECTVHQTSLLLHHILVVIAIVSAVYVKLQPTVPIGIIVEINTFLLTIKNLQRAPVDTDNTTITSVAKWIYQKFSFVIDFSFLATWVLIRLVLYPYFTIVLYRTLSGGVYGDFHTIITACFIGFCGLNYYWSVELVGIRKVAVIGIMVVGCLFLV
jgi:hypothetical protein